MIIPFPLRAVSLARLMILSSFMLTGLTSAQEHAHESTPTGSPPNSATRPPSGRPNSSLAPWTKTPAIIVAGKPENGNPVLGDININTAELSVISPDSETPPQTIKKVAGRWAVKPVEHNVGGIHLLLARETNETEIRQATTAWMFHAKAPSPAAMLAAARPGLFIQPLLIPEHGGFREGSTWKFLVRYDGKPIPGAKLTFDTENGSHANFIADQTGVASVEFPYDFTPDSIDKKAGVARTRRGFSLGVELEMEGIHHVTGFNHFYFPDLMRERSLLGGIGLFAVGMVLATPLLRRKKEQAHA